MEDTLNGSLLLSFLGCALASATVPVPAPAPDSTFSQSAWSAREVEPSYGQGAALTSAGDVNRDGYSELVAGSQGYRSARRRSGWANCASSPRTLDPASSKTAPWLSTHGSRSNGSEGRLGVMEGQRLNSGRLLKRTTRWIWTSPDPPLRTG